MLGHSLTAKLSARLGEGLFNGALTTRIGLAAIDVCRPLPYLEAQRPRFRELVAEVAGLR
jgi:putative membrane protein